MPMRITSLSLNEPAALFYTVTKQRINDSGRHIQRKYVGRSAPGKADPRSIFCHCIRHRIIRDDIDIITKIAENGGEIARIPMSIYSCVNERSALNSKVRAFIEFLEAGI